MQSQDNLKGLSTNEAEAFTETPSAIARAAGVSVPTVRLYGDLGFIEFIRSSNGVRLHRCDAAKKVRHALEVRLANKGHKR
jgi:DNA-binding transcriptional MerR regulator